jgi:DNA (cytosine-5)-methyltransferase 1
MNYLSVCSGIEAATVAWHHMGWKPVGFSEIDKFPSQVLAHHYPQVTNFGDMTKYKDWNINDSVGLLVGGTPCQSFSVAGLRKGLEDPRGNLALTYLGILDHFRPKWCVWENVPGVLSSGSGKDFGSFLGALGELGYGWAYRVLNAQYFGVAQRRKRVFVIGHLGDWKPAAEILFESESLSRNTEKSRKKGQDSAAFTASSFGNYSEGVGTIRAAGGDLGGGSETLFVPNVANCLQTTCDDYSRADGFNMIATGAFGKDIADTVTAKFAKGAELLQQGAQNGGNCVLQPIKSKPGVSSNNVPLVGAYSIREDAKANNFSATPLNVTPALQALRPSVQSHHAQTFIAQSFGWQNSASQGMSVDNISPTLDKSKTPAVAYGFEPGIAKREGNPNRFNEELSPTLRANMGDNQVAAAFCDTYNGTIQSDVAATMTADMAGPTHSGPKVMQNMAVRRLTPVECERLQGFPDNYTNIKENCPDGNRYKALGNSMAVPVMRWIGERINEYERKHGRN